MLIIALAFASGFALDVVWAACVIHVQDKHPISAANTSVAIYVFTLISTVLIVDKAVAACVAYAIGSWVGTYIAVRRKK
jgi:hypothetical protein